MAGNPKSLIGWFANNPVAANLLMLLILAGGAVSYLNVEKEAFPRFSPHKIEIRAAYHGAGPEVIESTVCVRIEEAVRDVPGIKRLSSEITEGACVVKVEVLPDRDREQMTNTLRGKVQAIQRLPKELERIEVEPAIHDGDDGVVWVALHGPLSPLAIKKLGDRIQEEMALIPGVSRVINYNETPYEIAIEVSAAKLRQHGLSLHEVAQALRRASLDLPGGLLRTPAGELLLRAKGRATQADELKALPLKTGADGAVVSLGDIASVTDGMDERLVEWHHNGETGQGWEIHTEHDGIAVARRVKAYVEETNAHLPEGMALSTWWDDTEAYDERIRTLLEDGLSGFVLVCVVLTLFLRLRVAVWAGIGILTSVAGALWLMPLLDVSLNMLSLFGFLLAMGILVDDAIIIGDNIHQRQTLLADEEGAGLHGAIQGTQEVALPVVLSVSVALVAFLPGLHLPGWLGQMMRPICWVMILTLVFSLVEALLILPAHLAHAPRPKAVPSPLDRLRDWLNSGLGRFVARFYRPFLRQALAWRYLTVALFAALVLVTAALVASGRIRHSLQADVVKNNFSVELKVPPGLPFAETKALAAKVERALLGLREEYDSRLPQGSPSVIVNLETMVWERDASFYVEFSAVGRQHIQIEDFVRQWRQRIGDIGPAKIAFLYKEGDQPYDIEIDLGAADPALLPRAASELKRRLAAYPGVFDVVDSYEPGKPEVRLALKPGAERSGLRLEDLARQARQAYFGEEIDRLQRGRNEVKVVVRLPRSERQSLDSLRSLPVRLPDGAMAPLGSVAEVGLAQGQAKLLRQDRRRVLKVQARVDPHIADVNAIYGEMETEGLKSLRQQFPGLSASIGQNRQEQESMVGALGRNTLIALAVIYTLIAVPFRSYLKPLIFLLAVPVAWSGAVLAHGLAGLPLSMESLVGMIAASGVVVNDSLVLLDYINERGGEDRPVADLVAEACAARFRPILLAFLTNFAGFLPTLLETSAQAQFLIPMTLSLSAGLLIGMAASLILTPVAYAVLVGKRPGGHAR